MTIGRTVTTAFGALALVAAGIVLTGAKAAPPSDTPKYDNRTEYAVKGTVLEVKSHDSVLGYKDTHFILSTAQGEMEVHVGPTSFLAKRGFDVGPGDGVLVIGSRTLYEGKTVLVAREIHKGDRTLTVRDMEGKSAWPKKLQS